IVLLGGTVMALTFVSSQRAVRQLSSIVLEQNSARVELQLEKFFSPPVRRLQLLASWGTAGLLPMEDTAAMNRLLVPLLQSDPHLSAVLVADERGREHSVFHFGDTWRSRQMLRDVRNDRAVLTDWSEQQPAATVTWQDLDYDPRRRPWYRGAVDMSSAPAARNASAAARVYWTQPYVFFTAQAPGITAALEFRASDGLVRVAGFDLALTDISTFTTGLRPGGHGKVIVLTDDGRVIGLPSHETFDN